MNILDRIIYTLGFIAGLMMLLTCGFILVFVPHNRNGDWLLCLWGIIGAITALISLHHITKPS